MESKPLTVLGIGSLHGTLEHDLELSGVQRLALTESVELDSLISLLPKCPEVHHIVFHFCDCEEDEINSFLDLLLSRGTVRHLEFKVLLPTQARIIFNKLKTSFMDLESLSVSIVCTWRSNSTIKFDFPDTPDNWNGKNEENRFEAFMNKIA